MHHHPQNRERAINLSILSVSGPAFREPLLGSFFRGVRETVFSAWTSAPGWGGV
uniref:Uncharacterized protein n=1 Tax=Knipowitschia caucasica TaxID=637954 RepID=A0AAV2IX81_KNICA